jgi:actin-related protein
LTEACFNTDAQRARLFETAFESLETRQLHLAHQSVLPLYACGHVTGVVVDVGHDTGFPVPIHEGYPMEFAVPDQQYDTAGRHITDMMTKLLLERKFKVVL